MSGGDLDGDEFFITWDSEILKSKFEIYKPALYDNKSVRTDLPPESEEIADHVAFYLERDILG